jgi:hypothetical protein
MPAMTSILAEAWRRLRAGRPVIVVSGLPRSGTSMMMRMLDAGGLPILTDGERTPDDDNPKGYFEHERVKDLAQGEDGWIRAARGHAVKVVSPLIPQLPATLRYRVIFMRRDLTEVLASQRRMLSRRGADDDADDAAMLARFAEHLDKVTFQLRYRPQFRTLFLEYRAVIENPHAAAERVAAFLDRVLDIAAMADAVDPLLYRNRHGSTAPGA